MSPFLINLLISGVINPVVYYFLWHEKSKGFDLATYLLSWSLILIGAFIGDIILPAHKV